MLPPPASLLLSRLSGLAATGPTLSFLHVFLFPTKPSLPRFPHGICNYFAFFCASSPLFRSPRSSPRSRSRYPRPHYHLRYIVLVSVPVSVPVPTRCSCCVRVCVCAYLLNFTYHRAIRPFHNFNSHSIALFLFNARRGFHNATGGNGIRTEWSANRLRVEPSAQGSQNQA